MTTAERVAALESRVAALEARLGPDGPVGQSYPPGSDEPSAEDDVFWALQGLQARVPDPGAVLITGSVRLPDDRAAHWQQALATGDLVGSEWEDVADVLAALGNPVRLRLLRAVLTGVDTVRELTELAGVGTSGQVYHHLRQLVAAGWLHSRGNGRYEVPVARVVPLLTTVLGAYR